jgi:5-methylcytosine-specific restriction endonuclease McrA
MKSGSREQRINRAVMENYEGRCHICGELGADEVDHVIALQEGGADTFDNRRPIHSKPCHANKTADEAARGRCRR